MELLHKKFRRTTEEAKAHGSRFRDKGFQGWCPLLLQLIQTLDSRHKDLIFEHSPLVANEGVFLDIQTCF